MNYGLDFAVRFYEHFGLGGLVVEVICIPINCEGLLHLDMYSSIFQRAGNFF